jgi:hypothetical protein
MYEKCKGFKILHTMEATFYCSSFVLPYQWLEVKFSYCHKLSIFHCKQGNSSIKMEDLYHTLSIFSGLKLKYILFKFICFAPIPILCCCQIWFKLIVANKASIISLT